MKENHGLPQQLGNGYKLRIDTYGTLKDREGYSIEEVDNYYGDGNGTAIAKIYSYVDDEDNESARVGVEFITGRLCIYGCNADIEDCTEEQFVEELTDEYYLG